MIEIGAVASQNTNLTLGAVDSSEAVDHSYSRFPNEATNVASATMSFDDFIDMINPLEHIPVLSSIYRAYEGETISPVSRIAGDTLYGGALGAASAALSAIGALGDEILAANNDGQSASKMVLAALSGGGDAQTTQVAQASPPPGTETSPVQTAAATTEATPAVAGTTTTTAGPDNVPAKAAPLDRLKLPYGGVMDTSMMASAQQNQALALAMVGNRQALKTQHSLLNSRFATAAPAVAATPAATDPSLAEPGTQTAMQNLLKELQDMKAINQYTNAAQKTPSTGEKFDVVN